MENDLFIQKRFIELSNLADKKGIVTFSDFLDMHEQSQLNFVKNNLYTDYKTYGGYDFAERQIIAFIPDALYYIWNYPIVYLEVKPLSKKYSEKLSHRDILGSLMNLGLERSKIGDIVFVEDKAYIICLETVAPYITENLSRVKHTSVMCSVKEPDEFSYTPKYTDKEGVVASNRLDVIIALAFNLKRNDAVNLIQDAKVFVNAKLVTSNAYFCKDGDIISVRTKGKFMFEKALGITQKGRSRVALKIYS
ncbi:MAG: RNA-binding protein [Lachnospiraceae bacterium]|nr:RNA-binding protein [Lachnospiraceae bacterium]